MRLVHKWNTLKCTTSIGIVSPQLKKNRKYNIYLSKCLQHKKKSNLLHIRKCLCNVTAILFMAFFSKVSINTAKNLLRCCMTLFFFFCKIT